VNKFDHAMTTYAEISKNNQRFSEFCLTAKTTGASNNDLASILIMPVQRIPRYELLLRELIKCTNEMHVDWANLQKAQKVISPKQVLIYSFSRKYNRSTYILTHKN
jgi:hypothetical protein